MKRLWNNCKGMVTVLVTLLLIPSILVSGTAVDLARIYAARSVVQDANQLAANSALASYDALLQDLYGLYGIMSDDPQLASMLDDYIKLAIQGQDGKNTGMGTFQLLYGSQLEPGEFVPASGQNLGNTDVLRRQIEEYAKFRAPVILVDKLLERLKSFQKVQKDAEVIKDKMELDDKVEDIEREYKKIYDKIQEANGFQAVENDYMAKINGRLDDINDTIADMLKVRGYYEENDAKAKAATDPDDKAHWEARRDNEKDRYDTLIDNLKAYVKGGSVESNWAQGTWADEEYTVWEDGYFQNSASISGSESLEGYIENAKDAATNRGKALDNLVSYCESAERKKASLRAKLDAMKTTLNTPDACSDELKDSLTTQTAENGGKSAMDIYEELLEYDTVAMAEAMRSADQENLTEFQNILENLVYGDHKYGGYAMTIQELKDLSESTTGFQVDLKSYNEQHPSNKKPDNLDKIDMGKSLTRYSSPEKKYYDFQSSQFNSTHNPDFYQLLLDLFGGGDTEAKKKNAKKSITKIFKEAQEIFKGLFVYDPEGAYTYTPYSGDTEGTDDETVTSSFGEEGDWGEEDEAKNLTENALDSDIIKRLGQIGNDFSNRLLLLTYDAEMFSNYSTNRGEDTNEKSMAGIPFGVDVNYYYQSELEYLYAGHLDNAKTNLKTVSGMILLVRFVFNYIASFSISSVNDAVKATKEALAGISGPFAFVMGELVRVALALGESALDVGRIRSGHQVKLYKSFDDDWKFSVNGLKELLASGSGGDPDISDDDSILDDTGVTMGYTDYLWVFLLFVNDATLAQRTKDLIQINVTYKKNDIGSKGTREARQEAITATKPVDLSKAVTGFSLTTTLDLNMLFLSMGMAQNAIDGVHPPKTIPISVTDYRGY